MDVRTGPGIVLAPRPGIGHAPPMDIALAASVDLLILGGSAGAVACALAARRAGCSVLIAAPHAGLGDDIAGHLRLEPGAPCDSALAAALFPDGRCPSPAHAKRTCEQAALDAGVDILLNALPCGVVRDDQGRVCGAVLAHRGGRSAVAARMVVDAGHTAPFARQAGLATTPWSGGEIEVETRLLGVDAASAGGEDLGLIRLPAGKVATHYLESPVIPASEAPWVRRHLRLALADAGPAGLLGLEAAAQLAAFHPQARGMAEAVWFLPPVGVCGREGAERWDGAGRFPLAACATAEPRLAVLGAAIAVPRPVAAALAAPAALCRLGERLGAALAAALPAPGRGLAAALPGTARGLAMRGSTGGFRPVGPAQARIPLDDGSLPLLAEVAVAVAGGGTGGAAAAIAAAREGAATLVLERLHRLGGVGTVGRIGHYWFGNRTGFTAELDRRVFDGYGGSPFPEHKGAWWVLEHKQDAWLRMLHEAGGRCWFGAAATAVAMAGERVAGLLVATTHGAGLVRCAATVDATGNADVAAAAGAPCRTVDGGHIAVQGSGLPPVDPRSDYQNSDHDLCDDADAVDATRMHLKARRKFAAAWDTAALIDTRERRQIRAHHDLTPLDIACGRTFPDTVVRAMSNFDSHGFTVHPLFTAFPMDKKPLKADVPYRSLLPQGIDGVLVTGLGMGADRDALPVVRMQPDVQNAGFSAGVAAAMAAARGIGLAALPVAELQARLVALGHLDPAVVGMTDSFPLPAERVAELVGGRLLELAGTAAAFAAPAAARPLLLDALADPIRRERAAVILGLQGDAAAAPVLRDLLAGQDWDAGWRFTGMGQFGPSLSPIDTRLVALGACGDAGDTEDLVRRIAALPADPALSHVRAATLAATALAARHPARAAALAAALADLLGRPGLGGHARTDLSAALATDGNPINTREREAALRELHLAAALHRLGHPAGRTALEPWTRDLHGHYARHAAAVLAEIPAARAVSG
jgi:hypothetical protein